MFPVLNRILMPSQLFIDFGQPAMQFGKVGGCLSAGKLLQGLLEVLDRFLQELLMARAFGLLGLCVDYLTTDEVHEAAEVFVVHTRTCFASALTESQSLFKTFFRQAQVGESDEVDHH